MLGCSEEPAAPPRLVDNVLMICLDTVRFDSFWLPERLGEEDALSPWLKKATVFSQAHSTAPWTVPAVGSVLTGLYPSQHGGGLFDAEVANLSQQIPSALGSAPTLAEMLNDEGFATAAITSHPWFASQYGLERGFKKLQLRRGMENVTTHAIKWLDRWLRRKDSDRFFLYTHFMEAHDNHSHLRRFDEFLEPVSAQQRQQIIDHAPPNTCNNTESKMCKRFQIYAQAIFELRIKVAELLTALDQRSLLDNTLVLLYSDHGEEFHDHKAAAKTLNADPRGFYGYGHGQSLYQELLRVPLIVWQPDQIGRNVQQATSLVDVVPSLLHWLGLVERPELAGVSQVEAARQNQPAFEWAQTQDLEAIKTDREIYASGIAYGPEQMAVLRDGWKFVWHHEKNQTQLFNLTQDPGERRPEQQQQISQIMDPLLDRYLSWFDNNQYQAPDFSEQQLQHLKGVGYLQGLEQKDVAQKDVEQKEVAQGDVAPEAVEPATAVAEPDQ